MKFTHTNQESGGIFLHGGYTKIIGILYLGPCWLSLVVSLLRTPILKCLSSLLYVYVLTDSEFSCLAMLAKPYAVSGPTYFPTIPNLLQCMSKDAHEVLGTIFQG